jgi:hypothetical protein
MKATTGICQATISSAQTGGRDKTSKQTGKPNGTAYPVIYTNLMVPNNGSLYVSDGVAAAFNNNFSAAVDVNDAAKLWNFDENIALMRNSSALSIEFRPVPVLTDTLFYKLYLRQEPYVLKICAQNFAGLGMHALLVDKYLHTQTEVNLQDTTLYAFTPDIDTNSYRNRFMLVINKQLSSSALAVTKMLNQSNPGINGVANSMVTAAGNATLYPNPITKGSNASLRFNNMDKGSYEVAVYNLNGQRLSSHTIQYDGGNTVYPLLLDPSWTYGIYTLRITNSASKKMMNLRMEISR